MREPATLGFKQGGDHDHTTYATTAYSPSSTSRWNSDSYGGSGHGTTDFAPRLGESSSIRAFNDSVYNYMTSFLVGVNVAEQNDRLYGHSTGRAGLFLSNSSTSAAFVANTTSHFSSSVAQDMSSSSESSSVSRAAVIPTATNEPAGVSAEFPGKNIIIPLYTLIFFLSFVGNLQIGRASCRERV